MIQRTTTRKATVERTNLHDWVLTLKQGPAPAEHLATLTQGIPAHAPGSVLGALIEAGLATDVTVDGREEDVAWAAECTWLYRTSVPRHADGRDARLVLEGVDTIATVRVDNHDVLVTDDMFHKWTVDLGRDDTDGDWQVEIEFLPAEPVARAAEAINPLPRADMYDIPFNQVRKMACSFGWDWGPTTITAGLWRAAVVERVESARIEHVRLTANWHDSATLSGTVVASGDSKRTRIAVSSTSMGRVLAEHTVDIADGASDFTFEVPDAEQWNVNGRGGQHLYKVEVEILDSYGETADALERTVGFRNVTIVQEPDDLGRRFEIHVNGARVWIRGFNWIPADVLPERVTRDKVRRLVSEAVATGANMLRVWGGGVVESDDFYDVCDELGVLVWQDFSFACAAYTEDAEQVARVRREVVDAVDRVGSRASLALWCGCNENLWGWEDWGWKERMGEDAPWGAHLYHDVIPNALAEIDPARPYIPGSPFSPDADAHPNDPTQGTTHHWDTWNQLDYVAFEDKSSRFASEFGWQAPASWPTLVTGTGHEPKDGDDAALQRLQKHPDGRAALERAIGDHVPHLPKDGRGWYLATQLVQARAIRASIGRFRSLHDTCSGALWWQLDDCWPALSWAVLDVAGRRKLGWHAAAQTMADRAVIVTADGNSNGLTLINDTPEPWRSTATVRVVAESGEVLVTDTLDLAIAADRHQVIAPATVPDGAAAVVVDIDGLRGVRWIVPDLDLHNAPANVSDVDVKVLDGYAQVTVTASDMIRDLVLLAETHPALADVTVDRQLVTLLPGETVTFTVEGPGVDEPTDEEWTSLLAAGTALALPQ